MTFLNPLVLFGLAAAAIPLILHLFNLRKLRTIEFSTLTFLKELQQTKIRRLKLRQILLLIVRTLLIILIILAFARPALRGTILGTIGTHAHSSVVFILDDSFSMTASDEHGEYFKQAKDATIRLIDLLKDGDEAYLVKLSDVPNATIDPATHDFSTLRKVVNESDVSSIHRSLDDALRLSAKLLQRSRNANKEMYVISDMQATLVNARAQMSTPANLFDEQVKFFVVEIGSKAGTNIGLDSVSVKTTILEREKPTTIHASLRNFNSVPLNDYVVSVFLDGTRAAQSSVSIEQSGSASIELEAIPKRTGFIKGYAEIEHDAIEQDDRRYFSLYVPEHINVAVVGDALLDDQFILLALQASRSEVDQSLLRVQQTTVQKFPLLDLKNFDVLVIIDLTTLSASDAQKIQSFVQRGGGVVLFPQSTLPRTGSITSPLLVALNIPPVDRVTAYPAENGVSFQKADLDHPLFTTIFEREQNGRRQEQQHIESPGITASLTRQAGRHGRTIISLMDGSAFLSEHNLGEGKILFFSISPVLTWSDFPLKGIFAPLIHRSIIYTSSSSEIVPSYLVGDEPTVTVRRSAVVENGAQFTLVQPDGTEELVQSSEQSNTNAGRSVFSFTLKRLNQPGFYEIRSGTTPLIVFAANIDSRESDMRKMTREEFVTASTRLGIPAHSIQSIQPDDQLQAAVMHSRFGVELWRYCIGLALVLALVEMLIARDSRKAMQGAAA
ncbi:MAG: BatA domain-containing protein [Ignavibacteriae bacterium]|nr:BatA domain-containing protein [Ignavibacteria bacterium]MBI3365191.1 BatA domain-containing protein [Ignavibacteriota bacterium]